MAKKKKSKKKSKSVKSNDVRYAVQSPFTDHAKGRDYKLTYVHIFELDTLVVTKTGAIGRAVVCKIDAWNSKSTEGMAVCHPSDEFHFEDGAKRALARCLKEMKWTKEHRANIWKGYFATFGLSF